MYYGIYGTEVLPDLVTSDKQLHGGPYPILFDTFFQYAAGLINWLERQLPDETFTIVIDEFESFKNNHWKNAPR